MKMTIKSAVIFWSIFVYVPISAFAQDDLHQLSTGQNSFSVGLVINSPSSQRTTALVPFLSGLEFDRNINELERAEYSPGDSTVLFGTYNFGMSQTIEGFLGAGVEFAEESLPEIVRPPSPLFNVGFNSTRFIGKTRFHYLAGLSYGLQFARVTNDTSNETLGDVRLMTVKAHVGIARKVTTEFLTFSPFIVISNTYMWLNMEADDTAETDSGVGFTSKIGLDIEISPTINLIGSTVLSERNSTMESRVYLSFHPDANQTVSFEASNE